MRNRISAPCIRILLSALLATLVSLGASSSTLAAGVSDTDLRGYKGGLVELGLKDASIVRGVLYGYTSEHLELEVAKDRTVKVHRSWVASLKAAPVGAQKSALGAFPRSVSLVYSANSGRASKPPAETPTAPPPSDIPPSDPTATPSPAPTTTPGTGTGPAASGTMAGVLNKGLVFQLKVGGNLLMGSNFGTWLNSSFMLGYKMGNITLGIGVEMTYNSDNYPNTEPDALESSSTLLLFQPTLEYYLAVKDRLVFYLSAGLHVGMVKSHIDPGEDITDPMLGFHAGLGLRMFFHPRFAVGIESGLRGVWLMIENDDSIDDDNNHIGSMSVYGTATLTAIW